MTRVLLAKTSLDGHWRGYSLVARALRDAGCEVIGLGMVTADVIAAAAVQEDPDVVGLNVGGRVEVVERVLDKLSESAPGIPVVIGGTVPPWARRRLEQRGIDVFPPGSSLADVVGAVRRLASPDRPLADALRAAEREGQALAAPGAIDIERAYRVQHLNAERRMARGDRRIGYKVACTSAAVRAALGAEEPAFGVLFASMAVPNGARVSTSELIRPRVEAEVALLLGCDLAGPSVDVAAARGAVAGSAAAIEIADSRIAGRLRIEDSIADNASSGRVVIDQAWLPVDAPSLADIEVTVRNGDDVVATGSGADVLGDPLASLAWLANRLARDGACLRKGDVVMTGSLHTPLPARKGDHIRAEFNRLPTVAIDFG